MILVEVILMLKNPDLLRKRLDAKEKEHEQKTVVALSGLLFMAAFITAGLNWRFGWRLIPDWAGLDGYKEYKEQIKLSAMTRLKKQEL